MRSLALPILLAAILLASFSHGDTLPAINPPPQTQLALIVHYTEIGELNTYLSRGWTAVTSSTIGSNSLVLVVLAPPAPKPVAPLVTGPSATMVPVLPYQGRLNAINRLYGQAKWEHDITREMLAQSFTPITTP